jgi:hypothetical protein
MWIALAYEVDNLPEGFMYLVIALSVGHLYRNRAGMICAQPKGWRRKGKGKGKGKW